MKKKKKNQDFLVIYTIIYTCGHQISACWPIQTNFIRPADKEKSRNR